jgi:hypothetical protein
MESTGINHSQNPNPRRSPHQRLHGDIPLRALRRHPPVNEGLNVLFPSSEGSMGSVHDKSNEVVNRSVTHLPIGILSQESVENTMSSVPVNGGPKTCKIIQLPELMTSNHQHAINVTTV